MYMCGIFALLNNDAWENNIEDLIKYFIEGQARGPGRLPEGHGELQGREGES